MIEPSVAQRAIPVRKRGSASGSLVDPFRCREITYESMLERHWAHVLIAHPLVDEVREQQAFTVELKSGISKRWVDFLVIWKSGLREACAVRHDEQVDKDDLREVMETAAGQGNSFADAFSILTELDLSQVAIDNARLIIGCANDFDFEAESAVANALLSHGPQIRIGDCNAFVGDGHRGSRAAIALIQTGSLVAPAGERIGRRTMLGNLFTK